MYIVVFIFISGGNQNTWRKIPDLPQVIINILYQIKLYRVNLVSGRIWTHNFNGVRHVFLHSISFLHLYTFSLWNFNFNNNVGNFYFLEINRFHSLHTIISPWKLTLNSQTEAFAQNNSLNQTIIRIRKVRSMMDISFT